MGFIIIFSALIIISAFVSGYIFNDKDCPKGVKYGCSICMLFISIFTVINTILVTKEYFEETFGPKAIEMYRGNTDVIVTYRDTIPIDTLIVLKENVKNVK